MLRLRAPSRSTSYWAKNVELEVTAGARSFGVCFQTWSKYKAVTVPTAFLFRGARLVGNVGMRSFWEGLLVMNTEPPRMRCSWILPKSTSRVSWTSTSRLGSFFSSMVWNVHVFSFFGCISSRNMFFLLPQSWDRYSVCRG